MRLEEERENRRLNELKLEQEMKLRLMELEKSRRRDERADRLKEQELNLSRNSIESRILDSSLTARTSRFKEAL